MATGSRWDRSVDSAGQASFWEKYENSTLNRLDTFLELANTESLSVPTSELAINGFVYTKRGYIECVWCHERVVNWQRMPSVVNCHRPGCSYYSLMGVGESGRVVPDSGRGEDTLEGNDLPEQEPITYPEVIDLGSQTSVESTTAPLEGTPRGISSVKQENERLKQEMTCEKCKRNRRETLFLPCRHLVSCETCAEEVDYCFHCKAKILGTVRTYMI
jgi:hypothetical protein